jgi:hypothetical protein
VLANLLGAIGAAAWAGGFAIVGSVFLLVAALCIRYGISKMKARSFKPERILRVLRQDQVWLQNEARKRP